MKLSLNYFRKHAKKFQENFALHQQSLTDIFQLYMVTNVHQLHYQKKICVHSKNETAYSLFFHFFEKMYFELKIPLAFVNVKAFVDGYLKAYGECLTHTQYEKEEILLTSINLAMSHICYKIMKNLTSAFLHSLFLNSCVWMKCAIY